MKLKWYGQASFLVTAEDGTMIVTDPYTPETSGYCPVREAADVVIRSSDNDDFHCRADLVPGEPEVLTALDVARAGGEQSAHGITFHCIEAMEALNHRFHDPDQNGMYRFNVDGVSIGHMGDVGNPLSAAQIDFFRGVDVLLVLTGGHPHYRARRPQDRHRRGAAETGRAHALPHTQLPPARHLLAVHLPRVLRRGRRRRLRPRL